MFKLAVTLPHKVVVAVSGGADSMAGLHFLNQTKGRVASVVHVNHNTGAFADESEALVRKHCQDLGIGLTFSRLTTEPPDGESREAFWRDQRYKVFQHASDVGGCPVVTCHNLDDNVEEYVMNTVIRFSKHRRFISPVGPSNTIRPFLRWKKADMVNYCLKNSLPFVSDPANMDTSFLRVKVRKELVPVILSANPALYDQVARESSSGR